MLKKLIFSCLLLAVGVWLVIDDLFLPLSPKARVVEIENFCGRVASELSDSADVALEIEYRYDAAVPRGEVFSQDPVAGSRRKRYERDDPIKVRLVVSLGTETVTLPQLVGSDRRQAEADLRALGCVVETVYQSGARPAGEVTWMEPRGGSEVPKGARVVLTVCAGTPEESVTVPQFYGMTRADALVQLWLAKLSLAEVVEVDSEHPSGTVVRQSHQAGTTVPSGTRVTLYVSRYVE
jgi:serine/threonine-protein kinase